uniref:Uncharacterized protein n=1 Tax=Cucumis melo TaxID=3656 RepID=A0A9I9DVK1_CUCME
WKKILPNRAKALQGERNGWKGKSILSCNDECFEVGESSMHPLNISVKRIPKSNSRKRVCFPSPTNKTYIFNLDSTPTKKLNSKVNVAINLDKSTATPTSNINFSPQRNDLPTEGNSFENM